MNRSDFKKLIAREFTKPDPQIYNAAPVLFEPNGRVWFAFTDEAPEGNKRRHVLMAYDGKDWIEHKAVRGVRYQGVCPNHAQERTDGANAFIDGRAFFACDGAVEGFDGSNWSMRRLSEPVKGSTALPKLIREPDGKGLLAVLNSRDARLFRWRAGEWREVCVPPVSLSGVVAVAPGGTKGAWVLGSGGGIAFADYEATVVRLEDWVDRLSASEIGDRDAATAALEAAGPGIVVRLIELQQTVQFRDADSSARFVQIIEALQARQRTAPSTEQPRSCSFGPYTFQPLRALWGDGYGHTFAAGLKMHRADESAQEAEAGLVMLDSEGVFLPMRNEQLALRWASLYAEWGCGSGALVVGQGESVWLPGDRRRVPAALFDMKKGKIIAECPDPSFHYLQATKRDGTLFVARECTRTGGTGPIMALRPGATDNRRNLACISSLDISRTFCILDDGSVVAQDPKGLWLVFRSGKWDTLPRRELASRDALRMIPGRNGAFLSQDAQGWSLVAPHEVFSEASLDELFRKHHKEIQSHFVGSPLTGYNGREPSIAFDRAGNVWLSQRPDLHLQVLVEDKWIDATRQLKKMGLRDGCVTFLAPVGEGNQIYMTDYGLRHDGGGSFLGHVTDGKLAFVKAPHCTYETEMPRPIREPAGALWVAATNGFANGTSDAIVGNSATRITDIGVTADVKDARPILADASGNAWLLRTQTPVTFFIWHDGKITCVLEVAGFDEYSRLFSDKPGSVFAWTSAGVQHFVEDAPHAGIYRLVNIYAISDQSESVEDVEFSPSGWLVALTTSSRSTSEKYRLKIFALPND
ncbi:MAG: hypothetical protein ACREJC_22685 [Tepidisphaeraceae bacterium]